MLMDPTILIQVAISGLLMGGIYALVAIGLSIIWGVTEIVNFAHGDYMMIAMFGAFFGWSLLGLDSFYTLPFIMVLFFIFGAISYRMLISKTLFAGYIPQIFSTFGLAIFLEALAQFLWTPDFKMIENPLISGKISIGSIYIGFAQLFACILAIIAIIIINWFLTKSRWGLAIQATSENKDWASLMGIDSETMYKVSWGIGSACVALAGVLLTNFFYIYPQVGLSFTMIAFVTVALGGFGSLYGTLVAGLLIGIVESVGGFFVGAQYKLAMIFVLYLIVMSFRPQGLFGRY
jgi:branched-chain amino acid transport system permease protein